MTNNAPADLAIQELRGGNEALRRTPVGGLIERIVDDHERDGWTYIGIHIDRDGHTWGRFGSPQLMAIKRECGGLG